MLRCPECGHLCPPGPDWIGRDRLLTRDIARASLVSGVLPLLIVPLVLSLFWRSGAAGFTIIASPLVGACVGVALAAFRASRRPRKGIVTFGPLVTAACCAPLCLVAAGLTWSAAVFLLSYVLR